MIYLTSTGFTFSTQLSDQVQQEYSPSTSVVIITNAAEEKENNKYAQLARQQFFNLGYNQVNFVDLNKLTDTENLKEAGLIYVCGGNTFQLMNDLVKNNLVDWLKNSIISGTGYIGVSAGSIILGSTIHVATIGKSDKNIVGIKDLTALGIISHDILPHYEDSQEDEIYEYEKSTNIKVLRIADDQVYVFNPQIQELAELKKAE